nr:uncharacterized protein LOC110087478 isoform X1 [Pogona vitticeps]
MMLLACLWSMSIIAACSGAASPFWLPVNTDKAERSRAQPPDSNRHSSLEAGNEVGASPKDHLNRGEAEENANSVRQALKRQQYPEEAEDEVHYGHHHVEVIPEHRQASLRTSPQACDCPDALDKGTLIAIVAALAFLGFFSSSILLVVAICILRRAKKQRKKEKEEKLHSPHRRRHPPVPPPRPEHTVKGQGYEQLHPASRHAPQGVYLHASDLHPGPRIHHEKRYQNVSGSFHGSKSTPENEYIAPCWESTFSTPPLESKYANVEELDHKSPDEGSPGAVESPKRREAHLYEEVE